MCVSRLRDRWDRTQGLSIKLDKQAFRKSSLRKQGPWSKCMRVRSGCCVRRPWGAEISNARWTASRDGLRERLTGRWRQWAERGTTMRRVSLPLRASYREQTTGERKIDAVLGSFHSPQTHSKCCVQLIRCLIAGFHHVCFRSAHQSLTFLVFSLVPCQSIP